MRSPFRSELWSPLTGAGVLLVDLSSEPPSGIDFAGALQALAELPCPTIGIRGGTLAAHAKELADRFDVLVDDDAELAPLLDGIARSPLAALALVQLLRLGESLDLHQALVAESLVYSTLQSGPEFRGWLERRPMRRQRGSGSGPVVRVSRDGERLRLTLNRPEVRNAFSSEMRDALVEALRVAACDPSVLEVRLDGAGPAFCSGGDLDEFGSLPDPATAHAVRSTRHPARALIACAERARVRVHGACVGAGVELPAFAAEVIAREDAWFQLPEVGMGLVPGAGGTASLPRRIGRQRTAWLALSGERLDATRAAAWGLVDGLESIER